MTNYNLVNNSTQNCIGGVYENGGGVGVQLIETTCDSSDSSQQWVYNYSYSDIPFTNQAFYNNMSSQMSLNSPITLQMPQDPIPASQTFLFSSNE